MMALSETEVFDAQRGMFRRALADARVRTSVPRHPVNELIDRAIKLYGVTRDEIVRSTRRGSAGTRAVRWICYRVVTEGRSSAVDAARRLGGSGDHGTVFYHAHVHAVTCGLPAPTCYRRKCVDRLSYVGPEPQEASA